jgi:hypothetical protein
MRQGPAFALHARVLKLLPRRAVDFVFALVDLGCCIHKRAPTGATLLLLGYCCGTGSGARLDSVVRYTVTLAEEVRLYRRERAYRPSRLVVIYGTLTTSSFFLLELDGDYGVTVGTFAAAKFVTVER